MSALWHALIVVLTIRVIAWGREGELWQHRWWVVGYVVCFIVIGPSAVGYGSAALLEARAASQVARLGLVDALRRALGPRSKPPQAWDVAWTRASRAYRYVIVTRADGERVGGLFSTESWASLSPSARDIFLEEAWDVDGDAFVRRRPGVGIWLGGDSIAEVQFLLADDGEA